MTPRRVHRQHTEEAEDAGLQAAPETKGELRTGFEVEMEAGLQRRRQSNRRGSKRVIINYGWLPGL